LGGPFHRAVGNARVGGSVPGSADGAGRRQHRGRAGRPLGPRGGGRGPAIGAGTVLDPANPDLLNATTIQFLTPTTYSVNGAGSFAYTSGGDVDLNGWQVQITGN